MLEAGGIGGFAATEQERLAEYENDETEQHAEAGCAEAVGPAIGLPEIAAEQRAEERAEINSHVEDGVGAVAANVGTGIKLPDNHRDIGLEEARADDDERECKPEQAERSFILSAASFKAH